MRCAVWVMRYGAVIFGLWCYFVTIHLVINYSLEKSFQFVSTYWIYLLTLAPNI